MGIVAGHIICKKTTSFAFILLIISKKQIKTVRQMTENFSHLYYLYGAILFEQKNFKAASLALRKSIRINPINDMAIFELAEISKLNKKMGDYFEIIKECLPVIYTSHGLSRCYRNIGYYFIEKEMYKEAIVMYSMSMMYELKSQMAQSQLLYIQQVTGETVKRPSKDEINSVFHQHKIQQGASETVLNIAFSLGEMASEQENYHAARFYYLISYDLTNDDNIKKLIDSLPQQGNG